MKSANTSIANKKKDRPALLAICLLVSILLHLAIIAVLHNRKLSNDTLIAQQKPTIVSLVDRPKQIKPKQYELDQHPVKPAPEPPPESTRLAEQNQRVEKETAPKGDDSRDQTMVPLQSKPPQTAAAEPKTNRISRPQSQQSKAVKPIEQEKRPTEKAIRQAAEEQQADAAEQQPLPSLDQLTQLSKYTVGRILKTEQARQERIKERADLETGDTVWLNLERGLLISFFRRFRNQIEGVWNYPREAVEKGMQGTLLLKITVNHDGELIDVDLLNSSGSDILDYEAIQAVYRAAPFGPLGKHYTYPDLKIMAHFRYQISGKYIYGKRR